VLLLIHTPLRTYTARARITFSMPGRSSRLHTSHICGDLDRSHLKSISSCMIATSPMQSAQHRLIAISSRIAPSKVHPKLCTSTSSCAGSGGALSPHSLACLSRANAARNAHAHSTDRSSSSSSSSSMPSSSLRAAAQAPADPHDPLVGGRWSAVLKSIGDDTIRSYMSWRSRCPCSSP